MSYCGFPVPVGSGAAKGDLGLFTCPQQLLSPGCPSKDAGTSVVLSRVVSPAEAFVVTVSVGGTLQTAGGVRDSKQLGTSTCPCVGLL